MRRLLGALVVVGVLAGLGWGAGAYALRQGAGAAVQMLADQGRGGAGKVTIAGFPSQFSVTLREPKLHQGLLAWQGEWLRLSLPSYAPWQLQLDLSAAQSLRLGLFNYLVSGDDMHAALLLRPSLSLALQSAALKGGALAAVLDGGGAAFSAEGVYLSFAATGTNDAKYVLSMALKGFALPALMLAPYGLQERAEVLEAKAELQLSAPLDRYSGSRKPQVLGFDLASARLLWGAADLRAEGTLHRNALGQAEGQITLTSPNWREVVALALALRMVQPPYAAALAEKLSPLATPDGAMTVALAFREGEVWLGSALLGPAPYLQ